MHQPIQDRLTAELLTTISELRKERTELNDSLRWAYSQTDKVSAELKELKVDFKEAETDIQRLQALLDAQVQA